MKPLSRIIVVGAIILVVMVLVLKRCDGFGTIIEASVPAELEFVGDPGAQVKDQADPNPFHKINFTTDKYSTGISYEPWSSDWQPLPVDVNRLASKDTKYTRMSTLPYAIPPWSSPDRQI